MAARSVRQPIVAGVDGSPASMLAVCWAAREAELRARPLRLVHAYQFPFLQYPGGGHLAAERRGAAHHTARRWLQEAVEVAMTVAPDLVPQTGLSWQSVTTTLLAESTDAAMLVVGSRGVGGFTGLLLGSTANELAAHARCPVAVIRQEESGAAPATWRPVVVGVDGSPVSEAAIEVAFREASARRCPVLAVHAWNRSLYGDDDGPAPQEAALLAERMAGWQEDFPEVDVDRVLVREHPAQALLQQADAARAQLMVLGSRGRGGFAGLLLGSTVHAVLHHARCPVLVVRPPATRAGRSNRTAATGGLASWR